MVQKNNVGFNYSTKDYYGRVYSFSVKETETEILIEQLRGLYENNDLKNEEINFPKNPRISTDGPELKETVEDKPFITYLKLIEDIQNDLSLFPEEMRKGKNIYFYCDENKISILDKKPSQVLTEISNSLEHLETVNRSKNRFSNVNENNFDFSVKDNGKETIYSFTVNKKGENTIIKQEKTQRNVNRGYPLTAEDSQVITLLTLIEDIKNKENLPIVLKDSKNIYLNFADTYVNLSTGRISDILADILDLKEKYEALLRSSKEVEERAGQLKETEKKRNEAVSDFREAQARIEKPEFERE